MSCGRGPYLASFVQPTPDPVRAPFCDSGQDCFVVAYGTRTERTAAPAETGMRVIESTRETLKREPF